MVQVRNLFALAALSLVQVQGVDLDVNSVDSIESTAFDLARLMASFYKGNETGETIGLLPRPYYFWEAGAMWNTLIQYFNLTGDAQYNGIVTQALDWQQADGDYMPANQSSSMGNDDQGTWALAALAAELSGLPAPENGSYVERAVTVFDQQVIRWDDRNCEGGLRWQIFPFLAGYDYKNSISNGLFFELAARLGHHTQNTTYLDWAEKIFKWSQTIGLVDEEWNVYDGTQAQTNCSKINKIQFSLNAGVYIAGSAFMHNATGQESWKDNLDGLLKRTVEVFFPEKLAVEASCEIIGRCNVDQRAFKGLLGQRLVDAVEYAPHTAGVITPILEANAKAAAKLCDIKSCPLSWNGTASKDEKEAGVGEYMNALSYVQGLLFRHRAANGTSGNGGSPTNGSPPPSTTPNTAAGIGPQSFIGLFAGLISMAWLL